MKLTAPEVSAAGNGGTKSDFDVAFATFERLADVIAGYQSRVAQANFEFGKALAEAKAALDHGQFLKFLRDPRVGIEPRTAERLM